MPIQLLVCIGVQFLLMLLTTTLLAQPRFLFASATESRRAFLRWAGMLCLGLTFVWSVILGCLLAITEITWQL